jgi:hypothetical protein
MKLYEIENSIADLYWKAETEDITEEELQKGIADLRLQAEIKLSNIGRLVKNIKGESSVVELEAKRLKARQQALDNRVVWLMQYVDGFLAGHNFEDALVKFHYQLCPPSVNVLDEKAIPEAFWKPQDPKLDKAGILQSLKEGAEIPGVTLVKDKKTLRLK